MFYCSDVERREVCCLPDPLSLTLSRRERERSQQLRERDTVVSLPHWGRVRERGSETPIMFSHHSMMKES